MVFVDETHFGQTRDRAGAGEHDQIFAGLLLQSRYLFRNVIFDQRRIVPLYFLECVLQNDLWNLVHLAGEAAGRRGPVGYHAQICCASVDHRVDRVEHIVNVLLHFLVSYEPIELRIRSFNESVKRHEDMSK
jgi:hypothetical protein